MVALLFVKTYSLQVLEKGLIISYLLKALNKIQFKVVFLYYEKHHTAIKYYYNYNVVQQ